MSRKAVFGQAMIGKAEDLVRRGKTSKDLRAGLSVTLCVHFNMSIEEIARALSISTATVGRLRKELREEVEGKRRDKGQWGGRRNQIMSYEEEVEFLKQWEEEAQQGRVVDARPIRAALEKKAGRRVAASTVYRMLARHGWRKLAPAAHHPKRDPEAQESFKKRALQMGWRKL